jgi:class 3 adenylate cyclase/tetratricopeptide (TPR) repeat protein
VVSDVRELLPGLPSSPQLEPAEARFRLFDSIATFLKTASQRQPLVLVLDDLHWADQPSLALLQFVARELGGARLLIVGTYRDMELSRQHPLAEALGELNRERLFQRVLLRGLTQEDVGRFIEMTSGNTAPRGLVEAVHTQTEGNPLFVTEVVRLLVQEGELGAEQVRETDSWTIRIPEGVREVIGRRLNRLSQRCNEALTVASVVGREFASAQIAPLVEDMTEDRLFEILEEALAARVIEELPQSMGQYQFTHALIQETLSGELSTTRKVRLHARIAEALEELYGDHADSHAPELAHHYYEAEAMTGSEKLVRYSLIAGERALASYAHEEALTQFGRALAAKEGSSPGREGATDAETADIFSGLGHAQAALNETQEAVSSLGRAFDYYVEAGDLSRAVAIAQNPQSATFMRGMRDIISQAVQLAPAGSLESGRVLSSHGYCLGMVSGGYESAQEAFDQALAIARANNDTALEMRVLANSANTDGWHMRWETCLAKSLQALELASGVDDYYSKVRAHLWAILSLLAVSGDVEGARFHAAELRATADRMRDTIWLARSYYYETWLFCLAGLWQSARDVNDQGLALFPTSGMLLGQRALLEHQVGDDTQGNAYLQRFLDLSVAMGVALVEGSASMMSLAQLSRITGRGELFSTSFRTVPSSHPFGVFSGLCGLALLAVQKGDVPLSVEMYSALVPQLGTSATPADLSVDHLLGLLSQTMGDLDQAKAHFEDALAFCRKAGYRPELAWTCCDYADILLDRDDEGDRAKAMSLLDESLAISSELGMRPLMERVLARKLELQGIASVDIRTSIDHVVAAVQTEQPDLRSHAAPDGTVTILFSDIEGSTQMTERLGDQRMQQVLRGHNDIVRHEVAAYGGFEVKSLGDGFMLAFSSARRGLQCAMAIQRAFAAHNLEHSDNPVLVRMGLHTGEFIQEMDDFFGKNVILASRIADQARGGEILVSSLLKELTESAGDIHFGEGQDVELKGLAGINRVYALESV